VGPIDEESKGPNERRENPPPKTGYRRSLKRQNQKKIIEFKKELIP